MEIIDKKILVDSLNTRVVKINIAAPDIALKALPGQFVILMISEKGERVPLTVVNADKAGGTVTLIFQELGLTTKLLGKLNSGDEIYSLTGPLGHATEIKKYGRVVLVGGGVGIAEIYPVAKAFKNAGNFVVSILGARTKELLLLEKEMKEASDQVYIATDDGSYGEKGFVTDVLKNVLGKDARDMIYSVGPIPMMKAVSLVGKTFGVQTLVSLNALMVDGTGMCGCCRVTVNNKVKFSCVDGPEFDAHHVDWDELMKRNNVYAAAEKHICKLNGKCV
jgi:ferredoxin/flavodoxin---NADP+ reductase